MSRLLPDGRIDILGADLRLTLGHFGHLYVGASSVDADRARTVGRIIEILNAPGGVNGPAPGIARPLSIGAAGG